MFTNRYWVWIITFGAFLITLPQLGQAYYTNTVSEEYPPITCDLEHPPIGAYCSGHYCDNFRFDCDPTLYFVGTPDHLPMRREWRSYISEEYPNQIVDCGSDAIITGMACKGKYCDNISVECSTLQNYRLSNMCSWTRWFSEEQGYLSFKTSWGKDRYARAMMCSGPYCDNKTFFVCEMTSR